MTPGYLCRMADHLQKWRMILGRKADPENEISLGEQLAGMDATLEALYDSERQGGLGSSSPNVNRWLGDIRKYFPRSVVQLIQKDALERLDLKRMLMEPELLCMMEPDVSLVATLISLSKVMPEKTKETARQVVRQVVEDLRRRLENPLKQAIRGSLNRADRNRRPKLREIDWHRTIRANLKNYQPSLNTIIPEQMFGHGRRQHSLRHVVLLVDQSGSMAGSVVYAGIFGAILASLPSVKTHFVAFDTSVADLTDQLHDPVEMLFGVQLGGGTDINSALAYAERLVTAPAKTFLVLISDLFEGGNRDEMLRRTAQLKESGVQVVSLLALDDAGAPAYDHQMAARLAGMDIPAFACTPDKFPDLMEAAFKGQRFGRFISRDG